MNSKLDQSRENASLDREQSYREAKAKVEKEAYLEKLEKQNAI